MVRVGSSSLVGCMLFLILLLKMKEMGVARSKLHIKICSEFSFLAPLKNVYIKN